MNLFFSNYRHSHRHHREQGFTLTELMVTVAIVGILAAIAMPNFQSMIQANRIQSAAAEFQAGLALARSEAIKRGGDTRVTIVANSLNAGPPTTANWSAGITVFYDTSNNASNDAPPALVPGTPNPILLQTTALNNSISASSSNPGKHVIFNGLGRPISSTGAQLSASFVFGPANGTDANYRCIIMSATGRTRSAKMTPAEYIANSNSCPTI